MIELSLEEHHRLATLIHQHAGIEIPEKKRQMMATRLRKQLLSHNLDSFDEYCDLLLAKGTHSPEFQTLLDCITTNKTDFFREPSHFDYLTNEVIPLILSRRKTIKPINIWCAASSTGEEPYTLAFVMTELRNTRPNVNFNVLASDISRRVLKVAKSGIYTEQDVAVMPEAMKHKYLLRTRDRNKSLVRVTPEIRSRVQFGQLNLMDNRYGLDTKMDVVFCRNVLIYFNRTIQEKVLKRICHQIHEGGFLFLGHSEAVHGMDLPLRMVAPTTYQVDHRVSLMNPGRKQAVDS